MRGGIPVRTPGPPSIYLVFRRVPAVSNASLRRRATVMNVARSTFVRRGYLLTALAVAVLLAGFSSAA